MSSVLCGGSDNLDFSRNGTKRNHQKVRGQPSAVIFICGKTTVRTDYTQCITEQVHGTLCGQTGRLEQATITEQHIYGWGRQWRWTSKEERTLALC